MNFEKFVFVSSIVSILILATSTMALADESVIFQSVIPTELSQNSSISDIEIQQISWEKKVSSDGVIEISGISFSVFNGNSEKISVEICSVIEGPTNVFTPKIDEKPACIITEMISEDKGIENQTIDFPRGVSVSDIEDISFTIETKN